jgi:hypothetical protein
MSTLYYHGRGHDGNSRNTFAGRFDGDKLLIGVSLCSNNDTFCKKTGRKIASNRLDHASKKRGVQTFKVADNERKTFLDFCKKIDEEPRSLKLKIFNFPEYKGIKKDEKAEATSN